MTETIKIISPIDGSVYAERPIIADAALDAAVSAARAAQVEWRRVGIAERSRYVIAALEAGTLETVKPGDARLARAETHLVATPQAALEAAAGVARAFGYAAHILGDALEGEARVMGVVMAGIARQVALRGQPFAAPCVLLSGGEATVTVRGSGRGGRNVEFLLSLAIALGGLDTAWAIAGDTDGVDGAEEVAGALVAPDTLERALAAGISPRGHLDNNDGHTFFEALGAQVVTGPTLTNVNDFRAILIG